MAKKYEIKQTKLGEKQMKQSKFVKEKAKETVLKPNQNTTVENIQLGEKQ